MERVSSYAGTVGRIARSVSQIAGLVNAETKFVDTAVNLNTNNTGAAAGCITSSINSMAEGDDQSLRNGRWILGKSLAYRMTFYANTAGSIVQTVGFAFIMDKKPAIAASATPWTDVFATADPNSMVNRSNSDRFVILKRGVVDLNVQGRTAAQQKGYINLKGIHSKFNGTTATSYEMNNIWFIAICNVAANVPGILGNIRYDFHDN